MQNFVNYYGVDPKKDGQIYLANGSGKAAWIDAFDIGRVVAATLTEDKHANKIYDVTGPAALSTAEATAILGRVLGHTYTYVDVPDEAARKAMSEMHMADWYVDGMIELSTTLKNGWSAEVATGVQDATGQAPRSFEEWAKTLRG